MIFYPYHKYVITSKLSSAQLKRKFDRAPQLQWSDDPSILTMTFPNQDNTLRFNCDLYKKYLKVQKNGNSPIGGLIKNLPEAKILFRDEAHETIYTVRIRFRFGTTLFLFFALGVICVSCAIVIREAIKAGKIDISLFIPLILVAVFYVSMLLKFRENDYNLGLFVNDLLETRDLT